MEVFRICKSSFSKELRASGNANRWNLKGQRVIYAGQSRSLATLELVVHKSSVIPDQPYRIMVISIADEDRLVEQVKMSRLPPNWRSLAAYPALQKTGAAWYTASETMMLKVPSVVIPTEFNFLINTEHPDFAGSVKLVRTEDYFWDFRLL